MTNHLLAAWKLDGRGGATSIKAADEAEITHDALTWVHLDYAHQGTETWLTTVAGLPELTIDALLADQPRPREIAIAEGLLVVLRGINTNEGSDPEDMVSLRLWLEAGRIISVRRHRLATIVDIQADLLAGTGPKDPGDFLAEVLEGMTHRIVSTVGELEDQSDALEELVLGSTNRDLRRQIGELRRDVIALRRYLAPQRDVVARLQSERMPWLTDQHRGRIREAADRVTRCVEDLDAIRDRAGVTQEELNNRIAEQMNNTMYTLSIVAAIFLPLGLLTGLLGINVGGMPGVDSPFAFTIVTVGLVGLGVGLAWVFRSRKMI